MGLAQDMRIDPRVGAELNQHFQVSEKYKSVSN